MDSHLSCASARANETRRGHHSRVSLLNRLGVSRSEESICDRSFFPYVLERELVLAKLLLDNADIPKSLPFETLTRIAFEMRGQSFSRMVKGQTDLSSVLMCIANSIRVEIHGGSLASVNLSSKTGDQISCLLKDWNCIEDLVRST